LARAGRDRRRRRQLDPLENYHLFDRFTNAPPTGWLPGLVELAPVPDSRIFFTSGGSEAVDTAIKLSRVAHAKPGSPNARS